MLQEVRALIARSAPTLAQDAAGVAALAVMLLVALHLPALV